MKQELETQTNGPIIDEFGESVQKFITEGFPNIATKLSYLVGESKQISYSSLANFQQFVLDNKSANVTDDMSLELTSKKFIKATLSMKNTIVMLTFNGNKTVHFSILTIDRTKFGVAPRVEGTIQNIVMIDCIDSLINSTKHVESVD